MMCIGVDVSLSLVVSPDSSQVVRYQDLQAIFKRS
jgi:hypothetical protein